jgi:uncharacterized protein YraI
MALFLYTCIIEPCTSVRVNQASATFEGQAMRYKFQTLCLFSAAFTAVPTVATAQQLAVASTIVALRAGPSRDYPTVVALSAGTTMTIFGCLRNYRWCDVESGPYRGWVNSGSIVYPYQGQNVSVLNYGATAGLGIVAFSIGNYWDNYYGAYPWYAHRHNWASRPWARYGSGYGTGYDWRAPTANVQAVTPANRLPPAQVRQIAPRVQQVRPQRLPRAHVQAVGRPVQQGRGHRGGPHAEIWKIEREGRH